MGIDPKFLQNPKDRIMLHDGLKLVRKLMHESKGNSHLIIEALPGPPFLYNSITFVEKLYSSFFCMTFFHICGTCRMKDDCDCLSNGVVDEELRVHNVDSLRIADSSVFPIIPSCPTAALSMAVGKRAAEIVIKAEKEIKT